MRRDSLLGRLIVLLLCAGLSPACDLTDPDEEGHRITMESGAGSQVMVMPVMPAPATAPSCPMGTGFGREATFGAGGGTIRLDPPVTARRVGVQAQPVPSASEGRFSIAEIPSSYPEVEVSAPAGRPIRITVSVRGCDFNGRLGLFRWGGSGWEQQDGATVTVDSLVVIDVESASRYVVGTF